MKLLSDGHKRITTVIVTISLFSWVLLVFNPSHISGIVQCHMTRIGTSPAPVQMMLIMNPISGLMSGWILMIIAMMLPKLILPLQYIYDRSLKTRRFTSAALFIFGYTVVWNVSGILIIPIELTFNIFLPNSYLLLISIGTFITLWQVSPWKQYCLNKGHEHPALAAFGWRANRDALKFGVNHGVWCVASGWALMFFPMLLTHGHQLAMVFVTFVMLDEHLEHPQIPRWRVKLRTRLIRICYAQTTMRLKQLSS